MTNDICQLLRRIASAQRANVVKTAGVFLRDEQGATMVEYGLMVALIAIVCIAAITTVGTSLDSVFSDLSGYL